MSDSTKDPRHIQNRGPSISPPGAIRLDPDGVIKIKATLRKLVWSAASAIALLLGGARIYYTEVLPRFDDAVSAKALAQAASDKVDKQSGKLDVLNTRTAHLMREVDAASRDRDYVRARIDFLVEQTVIEARRRPAGRQVVVEAAQRAQANNATSPAATRALAGLAEDEPEE
jgi:hypothetical protein